MKPARPSPIGSPDVTLHVAGVHGANAPALSEMGNHVALIVHGLATETNPGGDWYVDAGLGDGLYEPLPFVAGQFDQAGLRYGFGPNGSGVGAWHLTHDPTGSLSGVSISTVPCRLEEFRPRHELNATSSQSPFARTVTCQRRHVTGADIVRAKVYTRRDGPDMTTVVASTRTELLEILGDVFGPRRAAPQAGVESLWARVCAAHDALVSTPPDHDHHAPLAST